MNYSRIINRSFEIAWKYKSLWIFGMFAGSGMSNFNLDLPMKDIDPFAGSSIGIPEFPTELLGMFILAAGILFLVFIVASLISQAALIDSVNRIERGGTYTFSGAFSAGLDFFLRFLGIGIVGLLSMLVIMAVLILIGVVFFAIHTALGIFSLLILIPAFFFAIFFVTSVFNLADRVLVVRNVSIGDALEEGWLLTIRNLGKAGAIFGINVAFGIGFAIVGAIVWLIFSLPMAGLGLVAGLEPIAALFAGLILGLPISLVLGGILGVFFTNLYTLFYFELVEPVQAATPQIPPMAQPLT